MVSIDLPQVRALPLFQGMDEANFEHLTRSAYLQMFPAQFDLFREGEPAAFLHVVVDGCVELHASWNGHQTVMELVQPFGAFILAAVLTDSVQLESGRTSQPTGLLLIPAENVRRAVRSDGAFARAVVEDLAGRCREIVKRQKSLKLRTAVERLANSLLVLDSEQSAAGRVELPYDKRTLASLLGMTPENLSRAFNALKPYGVEVEGARIRLKDIRSLERLAKPTPLIDGGALRSSPQGR